MLTTAFKLSLETVCTLLGVKIKWWKPRSHVLIFSHLEASPKKKKCKKAKWLTEEALQIAVQRREVKSKGEKERYTHLNASSKE